MVACRKRTEEEYMIKRIYMMEDDFLINPTEEAAQEIINEWAELRAFRFVNRIPKGNDRIYLLRNFLDAGKLWFRFRREKKKREALNSLKRLRHDD